MVYVDMVRELLVFTRDKARDAVLRADAFRSFYPAPAVQRAYEEASFEIQGAIP
jgi:hypothetical protein